MIIFKRPWDDMSFVHVVSWSLALVLTSVVQAEATLSFGPPAAIGSHAVSDDPAAYEGRPVVDGDELGNWITVWDAASSAASDTDVYFVRSTDDGMTWSTPQTLNSNAASDPNSNDTAPTVTTDGAGIWIAAWGRGGGQEVTVSRSADTGQTWSAATVLGGGLRPAIATDGLGTWGIFSDGGGTQVQLDRSVDGGLTWLPRQRLDFDDVNNVYSDFFIDAATDGTGNWVACWRRGGTVVATRSADNGQTWSSPVFVGSAGFGSPLGLAMTTDAHGSWVIAWGLQAAPVVDEETGIHVARSIDNGATWSAPQLLAATFASDHGYEEDVGLEVGPDGAFYASWHTSFGTTGQDPDVFFSRSLDGGQTWTTPSAVNVGATRDGSASDALATVGYGGNGAWIGVWASDNSLNGTVGDDRDIFFARGQEDCPPSPSPSCLSPTLPGRSRLMLKDGPGGTDKLVWKWTAGQATTTEDLGDPTTGTSYAFCIYDRPADTVRVVFEADAGAGLACTDGPCWIAAGDGFAYRDSALSNGSIRSLSLTPGSDGRAKIQLRAAGAALGPPRMPLVKAPNIIAQLVNTETGKCWEATFSSATLNDSSRFKARSD